MIRPSSPAFVCALAVLCVSAVACGNRSATLQNPGELPSRWYIRCKQSIKQCQTVAREVCNGDYDVVQATGENPIEEYEASLDSSQGGKPPPSSTANWLGEMIVECDDAPPGDLPPVPKKRAVPRPESEPATTPAPTVASPALPAGMLCVPGATQQCLGPAACHGAQACASDGKSWERCDCGGGAPAPAAPSESPQTHESPASPSADESTAPSAPAATVAPAKAGEAAAPPAPKQGAAKAPAK